MVSSTARSSVIDIPEDILLIDKPSGITSRDVIRELERKVGKVKMGHAGTLDPMATGLMIIGVGDGTKKLKEYVGLDKTYEAEITLGIQTTTGDMDGNIIDEQDVAGINESLIEKTLEEMVDVLRLPVSPYSAMKQGGEPLYKKVRAGKKFIQPVRDMEVKNVMLRSIQEKNKKTVVSVEFVVGSGTYIRSLAEELGKRLKIPATLSFLRRTTVGEFSIDQAKTLDVL